VNRGLWGLTLGGGWTHDPWQGPPEDAWPDDGGGPAPGPADLVLAWREGLPVSLDGGELTGPALV
jgi:argininosuccinate synthase